MLTALPSPSDKELGTAGDRDDALLITLLEDMDDDHDDEDAVAKDDENDADDATDAALCEVSLPSTLSLALTALPSDTDFGDTDTSSILTGPNTL